MRFALQMLTLLALLVAPLAAPAAALASAQPSASECSQMHPGKIPSSHHRAGEPCCVAVPPAIDPPATALEPVPALDHLPFLVANQAFRLGTGPLVDDPPPRRA